jgi:predicted TIM-barrel fold metal-dependent hydrolase
MAIRILANHAHVFPPSVNPDGTIDRLLQLLDNTGIEQAVCFAPFAHQFESAGFNSATPNDWLAREIANQPRLFGFGTLDLTRSDIEAQVRHAKSLGFRGLKLHPNSQKFDILSPPALKAYAAAEAQEMFISFHSGVHRYPLKGMSVLHFDEVAETFPDLRFSLEHVGGYSFFPDALAVIVNHIPYPPVPGRRCMVYAGLTSCLTPSFLRFWYLPPERLNELILQAGVDQLIFGLDFPYNLERHIDIAINTIRGLDLPEADQTKILGGNLREALGLQTA